MRRRKQRKRPKRLPKKSRTTKKVLSLVHIIFFADLWLWLNSHGTCFQRQGNRSVQPKDDDPDGLKQLGAADCLEQAFKLLHPLSTLVPNNIDVWIATYDVAIRQS
jgi:hypothetical protein